MRKQVAISEATAEDLGRVATKNKVSRDTVISKMLDFFRIYGIDPFNYEAPHEEMTKIIKRFDQMFAFLKKQEKDVLKATLTKLTTKEELEGQRKDTNNLLKKMFETVAEEIVNDREENKKLRKELEETKKALEESKEANKIGHQNIINSMSQMFQNYADHHGRMGISDKSELKEKLKGYER